MPALISVTPAELKLTFTAAELAAIPEAIGSVELDAWLANLIAQASDRVIAAINSCPKNAPIRTGIGKVPLDCKRTVIVLARHAALAALPAMHQVLEGETRHDEYERATRDLDALAACDLLPLYELEEEEMPEEGTLSGGIGITGRENPSFLI